MKSIHEVELNRKLYHQHKAKNTVHRASLLVPCFENCNTVISFLNHFLLKRQYAVVACKITAVDSDGGQLDSLTLDVDQARVYTLALDQLFEKPAGSFLVEFFSSNNLFIPFPAVMVNHVGKDFCNVVHSYNRVLNDIFEDDAINKHHAREASIDFINNRNAQTFVNFSSGIFDVNGQIDFEYQNPQQTLSKSVPVYLRRLSHKQYFVSELFPELSGKSGGVLKVRQPRQQMFYGRLFAGTASADKMAFSANHSYYDGTDTREYWGNDSSYRCYPYFEGLANRIRMYPIMSPSDLDVHIEVLTNTGIRSSNGLRLQSPSSSFVDLDVNNIFRELKLDGASAYTLRATARNGEKVPARVNNQLVLADLAGRSPLEASINIALDNSESFVPSYKTGYTWGQMVSGRDYDSRAAFCFRSPLGNADKIEIQIFSDDGHLSTIEKNLEPGNACFLSVQDDLPLTDELKFVWFIAKSSRSDLATYSFHANRRSGHASGEHGF